MHIRAIVLLITLGFVSTAAAQAASGSKPKLSEVRSLVHSVQGHTDQLRELMAEYRSLVENRPQPEGGSPEAKKAHDAQLARWSAALDRLLKRIEQVHALVAEASPRLGEFSKAELPTALAKDVANAYNEAEAERANASQALAKKPATKGKGGKPAPASAKPKPAENNELDDLDDM
jgi:hypothetical protein